MQCGYDLDSLREALAYSEKYIKLFEMYPILRNQSQDGLFLSLEITSSGINAPNPFPNADFLFILSP